MAGSSFMPVVRCSQCRAKFIPPVYVCRKCGAADLEDTEVEGRGTVYTHTTIRVAPESLKDQVPYTIAIVEIEPELRVSGRLEGVSGQASVRIGQPVRFVRADEHGLWFAPES